MKGFVAVAVLGLILTTAQAENKAPNATLKLSAGSVAAGVGVKWGSGTLTFDGRDYPITVQGLSVGDVGVKSIEASGKVFNLKKLSDFDGNYTSLGAGLTAAGGGGVAAMKNQNGVTVELVSTTQGVDIGLGAAGVDMTVKR
ncbi:MAG TPA: EipA family protein [Candidatus Eisenbacteria bacterium]|nr:EipA family protein [Candidatus Eisenbacteria bacterium]